MNKKQRNKKNRNRAVKVGVWKTIDNINLPQADRNKIYCVFTMKHRDKFPLFNEIMCRLYILGAVTWFVCLLIYVWISGNDKLNNDKRKLFKSPFFIFSVIFLLYYKKG